MFRRFWIGESISFLGNQVTGLALPLTAVLVLDATADQMGVLTATWYLPYLVFGLPAGVWIDRMRRRPILVGLDLVAAAVIMVVPIASWTGLLRIELLYAVSFVLGSTVVVFMVAYQSFVPALVGRRGHCGGECGARSDDIDDGGRRTRRWRTACTGAEGTVRPPSGCSFVPRLGGAHRLDSHP
jgi:MFS family permease